nr:MAG TPA: STRUCTURAL MAINTENANCE OF CHROMOSOMES PROTEIN [Siphoviridae sp. cte3s7]
MTVKINKLEIENVKRVKAVTIEPTSNGLTILGGNNNQGKTSVLDAIAWALGGNKYKPSKPARDGSMNPPTLRLELSNGLIVERKGKNSDLKVTDPSGQKAGQQLLDSFVEELALNLPKFIESSSKDKANTLLQIIGVGEKLWELDRKEERLYNERRTIGQIADQKKKYAAEQPQYPEAPNELVSIADLIHEQQEILARNGENAKKRQNRENIVNSLHLSEARLKQLKEQLAQEEATHESLMSDYIAANKSIEDLVDESTDEIESSIANIEEINRKVRANLDKEKAEEDAKQYGSQYDKLTKEIQDVRDERTSLLDSADLPLPGLSVEDGELVFEGQKWDNMSGSQQLRVATAIVRKLKPECGFVLLDKLEQMDIPTLTEFGKWLESEGLQAIATRVSNGEECQIIIEDGYVVSDTVTPFQDTEPTNKWSF